jgi:hypothetical protein
VTLTGRAALAALTGALVILAFRDVAALAVVNGLLLAAIAADLVLAAPIRPLLLSRGGETKVLLGQSAGVTLAVANPGRGSCAPTSVTPGSPAPGRTRITCGSTSPREARSP